MPTWTLGAPFTPLGNNVPPGATTNANRQTLLWNQGQAPGCFLPNGSPDPCATLICPGGGNVSAVIGNCQTGYAADRISYALAVDSCNMGFYYSYMAVLEDPGHDSLNQPAFWVELFDQLGNLIPGPNCSYYVAVGYNDSGMVSNPVTSPYPWTYAKYKCWTTIGVDLSPYLGTTVTLTYSVKDCGYGGHWGCAYVDACGSAPLGLEQIDFGNSSTIFPNPFSTTATITFSQPIEKAECNIYNMQGEEVGQYVIHSSASFVIRRDNLPVGVYFYQILSSEGILATGKLVIQ